MPGFYVPPWVMVIVTVLAWLVVHRGYRDQAPLPAWHTGLALFITAVTIFLLVNGGHGLDYYAHHPHTK